MNQVMTRPLMMSTATLSSMLLMRYDVNETKDTIGNETVLWSEDPKNLIFQSVYLVYLWTALVVGLPGNILIALVYIAVKHKRTCDWFILYLSVYDCAVCLFAVPLYLSLETGTWMATGSDLACKIEQFTIFTSQFSSVSILGIIAVDRYLKICHPTKRSLNARQARNIGLCTPIVSALVATPILIWDGNVEHRYCRIQERYKDTLGVKIHLCSTFGFFLCMFFVVIYCYTNVCIVVRQRIRRHRENALKRKHLMRIPAFIQAISNVEDPSGNTQRLRSSKRKWSLFSIGSNRRLSAISPWVKARLSLPGDTNSRKLGQSQDEIELATKESLTESKKKLDHMLMCRTKTTTGIDDDSNDNKELFKNRIEELRERKIEEQQRQEGVEEVMEKIKENNEQDDRNKYLKHNEPHASNHSISLAKTESTVCNNITSPPCTTEYSTSQRKNAYLQSDKVDNGSNKTRKCCNTFDHIVCVHRENNRDDNHVNVNVTGLPLTNSSGRVGDAVSSAYNDSVTRTNATSNTDNEISAEALEMPRNDEHSCKRTSISFIPNKTRTSKHGINCGDIRANNVEDKGNGFKSGLIGDTVLGFEVNDETKNVHDFRETLNINDEFDAIVDNEECNEDTKETDLLLNVNHSSDKKANLRWGNEKSLKLLSPKQDKAGKLRNTQSGQKTFTKIKAHAEDRESVLQPPNCSNRQRQTLQTLTVPDTISASNVASMSVPFTGSLSNSCKSLTSLPPLRKKTRLLDGNSQNMVKSESDLGDLIDLTDQSMSGTGSAACLGCRIKIECERSDVPENSFHSGSMKFDRFQFHQSSLGTKGVGQNTGSENALTNERSIDSKGLKSDPFNDKEEIRQSVSHTTHDESFKSEKTNYPEKMSKAKREKNNDHISLIQEGKGNSDGKIYNSMTHHESGTLSNEIRGEAYSSAKYSNSQNVNVPTSSVDRAKDCSDTDIDYDRVKRDEEDNVRRVSLSEERKHADEKYDSNTSSDQLTVGSSSLSYTDFTSSETETEHSSVEMNRLLVKPDQCRAVKGVTNSTILEEAKQSIHLPLIDKCLINYDDRINIGKLKPSSLINIGKFDEEQKMKSKNYDMENCAPFSNIDAPSLRSVTSQYDNQAVIASPDGNFCHGLYNQAKTATKGPNSNLFVHRVSTVAVVGTRTNVLTGPTIDGQSSVESNCCQLFSSRPIDLTQCISTQSPALCLKSPSGPICSCPSGSNQTATPVNKPKMPQYGGCVVHFKHGETFDEKKNANTFSNSKEVNDTSSIIEVPLLVEKQMPILRPNTNEFVKNRNQNYENLDSVGFACSSLILEAPSNNQLQHRGPTTFDNGQSFRNNNNSGAPKAFQMPVDGRIVHSKFQPPCTNQRKSLPNATPCRTFNDGNKHDQVSKHPFDIDWSRKTGQCYRCGCVCPMDYDETGITNPVINDNCKQGNMESYRGKDQDWNCQLTRPRTLPDNCQTSQPNCKSLMTEYDGIDIINNKHGSVKPAHFIDEEGYVRLSFGEGVQRTSPQSLMADNFQDTGSKEKIIGITKHVNPDQQFATPCPTCETLYKAGTNPINEMLNLSVPESNGGLLADNFSCCCNNSDFVQDSTNQYYIPDTLRERYTDLKLCNSENIQEITIFTGSQTVCFANSYGPASILFNNSNPEEVRTRNKSLSSEHYLQSDLDVSHCDSCLLTSLFELLPPYNNLLIHTTLAVLEVRSMQNSLCRVSPYLNLHSASVGTAVLRHPNSSDWVFHHKLINRRFVDPMVQSDHFSLAHSSGHQFPSFKLFNQSYVRSVCFQCQGSCWDVLPWKINYPCSDLLQAEIDFFSRRLSPQGYDVIYCSSPLYPTALLMDDQGHNFLSNGVNGGESPELSTKRLALVIRDQRTMEDITTTHRSLPAFGWDYLPSKRLASNDICQVCHNIFGFYGSSSVADSKARRHGCIQLDASAREERTHHILEPKSLFSQVALVPVYDAKENRIINEIFNHLDLEMLQKCCCNQNQANHGDVFMNPDDRGETSLETRYCNSLQTPNQWQLTHDVCSHDVEIDREIKHISDGNQAENVCYNVPSVVTESHSTLDEESFSHLNEALEDHGVIGNHHTHLRNRVGNSKYVRADPDQDGIFCQDGIKELKTNVADSAKDLEGGEILVWKLNGDTENEFENPKVVPHETHICEGDIEREKSMIVSDLQPVIVNGSTKNINRDLIQAQNDQCKSLSSEITYKPSVSFKSIQKGNEDLNHPDTPSLITSNDLLSCLLFPFSEHFESSRAQIQNLPQKSLPSLPAPDIEASNYPETDSPSENSNTNKSAPFNTTDAIHSTLMGCVPTLHIEDTGSDPSLRTTQPSGNDTCEFFVRSIFDAFFAGNTLSSTSDPCLSSMDDDGIASPDFALAPLLRSNEDPSVKVQNHGRKDSQVYHITEQNREMLNSAVFMFGSGIDNIRHKGKRKSGSGMSHSWFSLDDLDSSRKPRLGHSSMMYLSNLRRQLHHALSLKNIRSFFGLSDSPTTRKRNHKAGSRDNLKANPINVIITRCDSIVMDRERLPNDGMPPLRDRAATLDPSSLENSCHSFSSDSHQPNADDAPIIEGTPKPRASSLDTPNNPYTQSDDQSLFSRSQDTSIDRSRGASLDLLSPASASLRTGSVCSGISSMSKLTECSAYTENSRSDCEKITRRSAEREHNITKLLGVITFIFVISWSVSWAVILLNTMTLMPVTDTSTKDLTLTLARNLFLVNHFCNIFVYAVLSKSFRDKLKQCYKSLLS